MTLPRTAIVVGAGVVGVSTAYALARRGVKVTLVDRRDGPAMESSQANGAQLSYLYTDALASPTLLAQLPRLALGQVPAFRMSRRIDPGYIGWLLAFLANCTPRGFRDNTLATLRLALESRLAMERLLARHDLEFDHRMAGKLHVYRNRRGWETARQIADMKSGPGVEQHALSYREALLLEPALERTAPGVEGVLHSPEESVGDPHKFSCRMSDLLVDNYGVVTGFGLAIERVGLARDHAFVDCAGGERIAADLIVDCSGAQGGRLLREHGIKVPIMPMKGYSFTAPATPNSPTISITDVEARIVFTNLAGRLRIAGLADLGEADRSVDPARMDALLRDARKSMPAAADFDHTDSQWAGLRPMTPDGQPRIARPHPRLAYNLGHGVLGWTLAMGSAERLAGLIER